MYIYIILFVIWLLSYILFLAMFKDKEKVNKIMLYECSISLFLLMALRKYTVGADIKQYLYIYNELTDYYVNKGFLNLREPLYFFTTYILKNLHFSDQLFISFFSLIEVFFIYYFLKKNSKNVFLSFVLFVSFDIFTLFMSGLRQSIALCIILFSFEFIKEKKLIKFIVCIIIAYLFHNSAIVCLPMYFLYNLRFSKKTYFLLIALLLVFVIFANANLFNFINYLIPEYYMKYLISDYFHRLNILVPIELCIILLFCIFFLNKKDFGDKSITFFLNLSIIGTLLNIISINSIVFGRLAYYYLIANIILIPISINQIKDKKLKLLITFFVLVIAALRFIITVPGGTLGIDNYLFFWQ